MQMAENELAVQPVCRKSWLWNWLPSWNRSDPDMLRSAERKILSYLKTSYRGWYVDIGPAVGTSDKIWTVSLNEDSKNTPLLLLHGLASGVALWCLNLDSFAVKRPVYAVDVLGFGRSSRPSFSSDALEAEQQLVQSVEEWRKEMKLDQFILLGHSMGGFIAASYAIKHPERVKHLILADPWGFTEKPEDLQQRYNLPFWARGIFHIAQHFNPLATVRAVGPFGQMIIQKFRPDILRKFEPFLKEDIDVIPQYIYQCNAQKPSGESAFHAMMSSFGWAKYPMINRMNSLSPDIPITFIYGSRSWVDMSSGTKLQEVRGSEAYVNVITINGAGHHVYADKADVFNKHVVEICDLSDNNKDKSSIKNEPNWTEKNEIIEETKPEETAPNS